MLKQEYPRTAGRSGEQAQRMARAGRLARPKLLYLSFNVTYHNPTRELLCDILRSVGDATFFGPGYQKPDVVQQGVDAFVASNGPFDFVVADETSIEDFSILDQGGELRFRNHACRFDKALLRMGRDYQEFLTRYGGVRLIALLQSDYYNFSPQRIDIIESIGDYFLTWGAEFIAPKAALGSSGLLPGGIDSTTYAKANDNYLEFISRCPARIICCPHFVAERELFSRPLAARPYDWSILGADYDARVRARARLDEAGIARSGDWLRYVFAAAQKLQVNLYNKYAAIAFMQWAFRRALRQSKYGFTCGSFLRWAIRKYYEIPANGCVLVCERPNGFTELGFIDRENAIICEAKDILDVHSWLSADPVRAQAIADSGRELVSARHSLNARAQQVASALDHIRQGTFRGSRWQAGAFEVVHA